MIFIAVCAVLALGFYSAGMAFIGAHSYLTVKDWHYLAGTILYTLIALWAFWWVGSGLL